MKLTSEWMNCLGKEVDGFNNMHIQSKRKTDKWQAEASFLKAFQPMAI